MKDPQKIDPPVEVTLAKSHKHAGVQYQAGDKITVTAPERDWLAANQVINEAPASASKGGVL